MTRKKLYWVYFLYDNDRLVYIGMTGDLKTRISAHRNKAFNSVAVDKFKDKMKALDHERFSIVDYRPKYNWIPPHIIKKYGPNPINS